MTIETAHKFHHDNHRVCRVLVGLTVTEMLLGAGRSMDKNDRLKPLSTPTNLNLNFLPFFPYFLLLLTLIKLGGAVKRQHKLLKLLLPNVTTILSNACNFKLVAAPVFPDNALQVVFRSSDVNMHICSHVSYMSAYTVNLPAMLAFYCCSRKERKNMIVTSLYQNYKVLLFISFTIHHGK